MADFSTYKPTTSPPDPNYWEDWEGAMDELDARFNTAAAFGGTLSVAGAASLNAGGVLAGEFSGEPEFTGAAFTWSGNPTHSGNHTWNGTAFAWPNNPTHSGAHAWNGTQVINDKTTINVASGDNLLLTRSGGGDRLRFTANASTFGSIITSVDSAESDYRPFAINASHIIFNIDGVEEGRVTDTGLNVINIGTTTPGSGAFTTLSATGKVYTPLSATGGAGLIIPHGAAPTAPVNGDEWSTTAGRFCRINGVTKQYTLT